MSLAILYHIQCKGRDSARREVLDVPVPAEVEVTQQGNNLWLSVKCPYNTGSHGHRCRASHPGADKVGEGIACPYAVDLPYAIDTRFAHEV